MKTNRLLSNYIDTFFSGIAIQFVSTPIKLTRILLVLFVSTLSFVSSSGQTASRVDSEEASLKALFVGTTSDKTNSTKQSFRIASERPKLTVQLLLNEKPGSQNTADAFVAIFDEDFSAKIGDEDSYKFTNRDENIAIDRNGIALSIEGRPIISGCDTIPVRIWRFRQNTYLLRIVGINFEPAVSAYVKDAFLHIETPINLTGETLLPFGLTSDAASSAPNRFTIIFKESKALPVVVTDIKASARDRAVQIEWTSHTETNIDRYEIERSEDAKYFVKQGAVLAKANNSTIQLYNWSDQSPAAGTNFYRIKIIEKSGEVKYTTIVKVDIAKGAGSLAVYPNPVQGKTFSINLKNMEKGRYSVMLYNNTGQSVFSTSINHEGGNVTYPISANVIGRGTYQLNISTNNLIKTTLIIFN